MGPDTAAATVTVGIPTYRRSEILPQAIESVLAQTFKDFVCVVWADGPDADTERVVSEFVKRDERVFYLVGPHVGQFKNANRLLSLARSKYVALLSDDDMWEPRFLECCIAALEASHAPVAHTDFTRQYPDGTRMLLKDGRCALTFDALRRACLVNTSAAVMSKNGLDVLLNTYGHYYDPRIRASCGDWLLWVKLWQSCGPFVHVCEPLSVYRLHAGQQTYVLPVITKFLEDFYVRSFTGVLQIRTFKAAFFSILWRFHGPTRRRGGSGLELPTRSVPIHGRSFK